MKPKISVIVASYKNGDYIYETLDSIFAQTYENIELIVTDDGTPDFDIESLRRYIDAHKGSNIKEVRYNLNQSNLGTVRNLEIARSITTGEFISAIAADDVFYDSQVLVSLYSAFVEDDALGLAIGQIDMCDQGLNRTGETFISAEDIELLNTLSPSKLFEAIACRVFIPAMATLGKRSIYDQCGSLSSHYRIVEDWTFHLRLARQGIKIGYVPCFTGKHRGGGISHGNDRYESEIYLAYRKDLVTAYQHEILPYINRLTLKSVQKVKREYKICLNTFQHANALHQVEKMPPFVSIVVVTYNSSQTIVDTLDSIFHQSYSNIELIITDDHSTDETVAVVKRWIEPNAQRFIHTQVIESNKNTGVSLNCNRGFAASRGEFVKFLAGDDLLSPNYTYDMVFSMLEKNADIAFCYERVFYPSDIKYFGTEYEALFEVRPASVKNFLLEGDELYQAILNGCFFPAPTAILKRSIVEQVGGFDERYPSVEDYPFWVKALKRHASVTFVGIHGVYYRKSSGSASWRLNVEPTEPQKKFMKDLQRFVEEVCNPERALFEMEPMAVKKNLNEADVSDHEKEMERKIFIYEMEKAYKNKEIGLSTFLDCEWRKNRLEKKLIHLRHLNRARLDLEWHRRAQRERILSLKRDHSIRLMSLQRLTEVPTPIPADKTETERRAELSRYHNQLYRIKNDYHYARKAIKKYFSIKARLARWDDHLCAFSTYCQEKGRSPLVYRSIKVLSPMAIRRLLVSDQAEKQSLSQKIHDFIVLARYSMIKSFLTNRHLSREIQLASKFEEDEQSITFLEDLYQNEVDMQEKYAKRENQKGPIRILFVIHLFSAFSSVESIYLAMLEDERFDPHLLLIPWKHPDVDQSYHYDANIVEQIKARGYQFSLGYEKGRWKSIFSFNPEGVFFQTPYDDQWHPIYHCTYRACFPKIMYTPYGPWVMDKSVEFFINSGLKPNFFNAAWRVFMDKLSLEMLEYAAPQHRHKCVLTGSPKVDFHLQGLQSTRYCWKNPDNTDLKRIIWMPRWGLKEQRSSFLDYYQQFMQLLVEREDIDFVFRPHPLLFSDLKRNKFLSDSELDKVIFSFNSDNSVIDYDHDYREGLLSCDFLVMDFSSIVYEVLPTGKPVIYTKKDNTLIDPRIMEVCYVVESWEELSKTMRMLLNGEDPLRGRREELVRELDYFPGGVANGILIKDYIANHIRE